MVEKHFRNYFFEGSPWSLWINLLEGGAVPPLSSWEKGDAWGSLQKPSSAGAKAWHTSLVPCVWKAPLACKLAECAQTAPRGNPRTNRFVVPETLTKHSTQATQRGQSGSCSSSCGGQKLSPRNYRRFRWKEGTGLPSAACSDSCLHFLFLPTQWSEVKRCAQIPLTGYLVVKVPQVYFNIFMVPPWALLLPWEKIRKSGIWNPRKSDGQTTPGTQRWR